MKYNIKGISYKVIDWSLHFISYATILVLVATFFDSFKIDDNHLYLYGILATLIIFILNIIHQPSNM